MKVRDLKPHIFWLSFAFLVPLLLGILCTVLSTEPEERSAWAGYIFSVLIAIIIPLVYENIRLLRRSAPELRREVRTNMSDFLLNTPDAIHRGFHETTRHLLSECPTELRSPVTKFVQNCLECIINSGFVFTRAEFKEYRNWSCDFVRSLYESESSSTIWTVCLYCPLDYLRMTTGSMGSGRPLHLLVFDGIDRDQGYKLLTNGTNTKMTRVVYLNKKRIEGLFQVGSGVAPSGLGRDEFSNAMIFSYIWFLCYNRHVKLFWSWRSTLQDDLGHEPRAEEEDFMVFNSTYYWRYDILSKLLMLCWLPGTLFKEMAKKFDLASRTFQTLQLDASNSELSGTQRRTRFLHPDSLYDLILNTDSFRENSALRATIRNAFVRTLKKAGDKKNWSSTCSSKGAAEGTGLFIATLVNPLLNKLESSDEDGFKTVEALVKRRLQGLSDRDRKKFYRFLDSPNFEEGVRTLFPATVLKDLWEMFT